ncbi:MAG: tonB-system energizer ExbB [Alphaproteobacteria bacterium]|jgi:biopolymer transport protein ExbB|uniref:tonB-system energizer ExbB n=1 Tax=Brevundimonas sp. TaxID=1871086 RepID=UPI00121D36DC|nr:tonB-system energizer ExbB [Brevundimonas sp.]MBU3972043.1 tonB-system energizer ExbB [Alphaproteobacteria bacterium]MBA3048227.1 tonB-system energizer ExbB [Brevundimonas sp.]MBU3973478.1 tonB-system energizer ExbB [Alphaproteobacteria bacterium]MBU4038341.1 tonB-system energizer ExbB [Alphaproteobacteria bacterium]MBU4135748.1 tonB-system energizer ExbB [Alphaproteobacteria bacterium]
MFDIKKTNILLAMAAAGVLMAGTPVLAQDAPAADPAAAAAAPAADAAAAPAAPAADPAEPAVVGGENHGKMTPASMFMDADPVVKTVMIGLVLASVFSWVLLLIKIFEFGALNRRTDNFLESFRQARTIADMRRVATADEFDGNPLADMAAAATDEIELSRQAGLSVTGDHADSALMRAQQAVSAVQAGLAKRLSGGQQFLASVGSTGPFIGLFGTVYGIMNSFIGIANTNTTNLAVVAPGIAEALLATGIGLFAAIPAVIFYNYFNTRISAYGTRSDGFSAELTNAISRNLDKGA